MSRLVVVSLRVTVIVALAAAVFVQVALVRVSVAASHGGRWIALVMLVALVVLCIAAVEFALAGIWRLVSLAAKGAAFTPRIFVWLNLVIKSAVAGAILGCVLATFLGLALFGEPGWNGYVYPISALAASLFAGVTALGLIVVRALLVQSVAREEEARRMRAELDEVI